jgi:hypothetical protein
MQGSIPKLTTNALLVGAACVFVLGHPAKVQAQNAFCPPNFIFINGSCAIPMGTKLGAGAFSGAALASQALSELSETTTQQTTANTDKAIVNRREQEQLRCPEAFSRVEGVCKPNPPQVSETAPVVPPEEHVLKKAKKPKAAASLHKEVVRPKIVSRAPPPQSVSSPVAIEPAVRYGTWTQVYGDYEKREAAGPGILTCCTATALGPGGLALNIQSRTGTVGFLAGADLTARDLFSGNDGLVVGVTAGYVSSNFNLNSSSLSTRSNPGGTGVSHLQATLSGPTAGAYATYFNGGFSADIILKADVLDLNENFNEVLVTTSAAQRVVPVTGGGSVSLLNGTIAGNLNYRFDLYPSFWIEPTVGAQYTNSSYGSNAADFGLADGNLVMVQGGARFGTSTLIDNHILLTATLTGLAYDDVLVTGSFIPAGTANGINLLVQSDQGFVRGRGILALNFDFGEGITSFVQGEVRGGAHLFGAGGKAGVRYQF